MVEVPESAGKVFEAVVALSDEVVNCGGSQAHGVGLQEGVEG